MATAAAGSPRCGRTSAWLSRPGAASMSAVVAPLVHSRPRLAGCSLSPLDLDRPGAGRVVVATSSTRPQPTPQYEQTVRTRSTSTSSRRQCTSPIVADCVPHRTLGAGGDGESPSAGRWPLRTAHRRGIPAVSSTTAPAVLGPREGDVSSPNSCQHRLITRHRRVLTKPHSASPLGRCRQLGQGGAAATKGPTPMSLDSADRTGAAGRLSSSATAWSASGSSRRCAAATSTAAGG